MPYTTPLQEAIHAMRAGGYVSPFATCKHVIFGDYSAAGTLRRLVLSLYNGDAYPMALHRLSNLDRENFEMAMTMLMSYKVRGEGDQAFMLLARQIEEFEFAQQGAIE